VELLLRDDTVAADGCTKAVARSLRGRNAVERRKMVHAEQLPGVPTGAELPAAAIAE
jgi:hypothetical protein